MKVEIVEASLEHAIQLVGHLRDSERALYEKIHGANFERLVVREINESVFVWAGLVNGECGVIWGVKMSRFLSDEGTLWMLGNYLVDEHPITFLRYSRKMLEDLRGTFKVLNGCVLTEYSKSRAWLEWLGFEIGPDQGGICACQYRFA